MLEGRDVTARIRVFVGGDSMLGDAVGRVLNEMKSMGAQLVRGYYIGDGGVR